MVTADFLQNERDHNFQGENTQIQSRNDTSFSSAQAGGWFSWDLKVLPDQPQELYIIYRDGGSSGTFDVFMDGTKLDIELTASKGMRQRGGTPSSITYPLSPELLKGKSKITVKFQASSQGRSGSIYNLRITKPKVDN